MDYITAEINDINKMIENMIRLLNAAARKENWYTTGPCWKTKVNAIKQAKKLLLCEEIISESQLVC